MTNSVKKLIVSNRRYSEIQAHTSLTDVLLGNFEIIADVLSVSQKDDFYCYVARFIHIQAVCLHPRSRKTQVSLDFNRVYVRGGWVLFQGRQLCHFHVCS